MKKKLLAGNPLKIVSVAGLVLALIISWCMVLFTLFLGTDSPGRRNTFSRSLREYDLFDAQKRVLEGAPPNQIEKRLSRLQKRAKSAEEQLSMLKRRRALALIDRRYIDSYTKAAQKAAETFTYSSTLTVVAAEATLLAPFSEDARTLLQGYALRITQNRFDLLDLGIHILAGNLDSPAHAVALPQLPELLSIGLSGSSGQTRQSLLIDEFLLLAYRKDIPGASRKLNTLLADIPEALRMGAEFYYDHSLPLNAAELFFRQEDHARAADALVLAGDVSGARNIWLALSQPSSTEDSRSRQIRLRSTYNLASSSADQAEEALWLERLFPWQQITQGRPEDSTEIYSVIRYTRLLDTPRSIAVLDDEDMRENPLLDLELLQRRLEELPPTRATAEVWLLLGRHSEDEAIHEWAAWYFDHQRLYGETDRLIKEAVRKGMTGSWLDLHRGLASIREGKTAEGERIFREALDTRSPNWRIYANLGRIQESRRVVSAALEYYETAAALVKEKGKAAQVQIRISRCLESLGRIDESRRALEYALQLDPENINIRRALRRFNSDNL